MESSVMDACMDDTPMDEVIMMMKWLESLETAPRIEHIDPQTQEAAQTLMPLKLADRPQTASSSSTSRLELEDASKAIITELEGSPTQQPARPKKESAVASDALIKREETERLHPRLSLLGLPPELRNAIFAYVLPEENEFQEFRFMYSIHSPVPTILQVCRQIRSETLIVYYTNATFELMTHWKSLQPMALWLRSTDPAARSSLYMNTRFNVRVIVDGYHPDFPSFYTRLGHYWLADPEDCGLLVLAHKAEHERRPIESLRRAAKCRQRRLEKKAYEKRVDDGGEGQEAREALERKRRERKEDVGRRKLKEVLLGVWDRIEVELVGKDGGGKKKGGGAEDGRQSR
ncbi:hypothetical protein EJ03DRAFT_86415 [Teratosphaeria nubilosa]|uniref:F-box domain-containing protein n=1 Tax=Teratosphaeria nubilosa TaxID=161662 RepID=A0A6G1LAK7_9PEZI|nr:hypothetical protein EJ03DRAFT_86415 [Teratosphaeria nubilosa]